MDLSIVIPSVVAIFAIGLYVVALWIGDHKTISLLTWTANVLMGGAAALVALSWGLGVQLTLQLVLNPGTWITAIGKAVSEL